MSDNWHVLQGDCREQLRQLREGCLDACVTDPPYEIEFMNRAWDGSGVAFQVDTWREVYRVLKPGAYLLAFSGKYWHRMAVAIEDAGFEIRDWIDWVYGNGFPKYLSASKAIDAHFGVKSGDRPIVGEKRGADILRAYHPTDDRHTGATGWQESGRDPNLRGSVTPEARRWDGWSTALKPAHEPIIIARKPLVGTVAENVLTHGTGVMNTNACRVGSEGGGDATQTCRYRPGPCQGHDTPNSLSGGVTYHKDPTGESAGRWPPNLLLSHADDCEYLGERVEKVAKNVAPVGEIHSDGWGTREMTTADADVKTAVYRCVPGCPVLALDQQSGASASRKGKPRASAQPGDGWGMTATGAEYDDAGGASRFFPTFYCAKPTRKERDLGCDELPMVAGHAIVDREEGSAGVSNPRAGAGRTSGGRNSHPTVKPIKLMRWLVRLVAPPGGVVLDPFCGSGTTGMASLLEGARFLGVELGDEPNIMEICRARIAHAEKQAILAASAKVVAR